MRVFVHWVCKCENDRIRPNNLMLSKIVGREITLSIQRWLSSETFYLLFILYFPLLSLKIVIEYKKKYVRMFFCELNQYILRLWLYDRAYIYICSRLHHSKFVVCEFIKRIYRQNFQMFFSIFVTVMYVFKCKSFKSM